jgi:hypothetical protein
MTHQPIIPSIVDPTDAGDQPQWEVWLELFCPHRTRLLVTRVEWDPVREGPRPALERPLDFFVEWALEHVPEDLDLGHDDDGRPIIAAEEILEVSVVAPDGTEIVVEPADRRQPKVFGWRTLEEYEERERISWEGRVEERSHMWLTEFGRGPGQQGWEELKIWVWNDDPPQTEEEDD